MIDLSPSRRRFLAALGGASLPLISVPSFLRAQSAPKGRILVLVELAGGNDGLNTVVPMTDPAYHGLRPEIGIGRDDVLTLDSDTGLHPVMRGMADLWERGEMRVIEGVGYPNPNRSHFRSIEIWNAGLGAYSQTRDGWIAGAFDGRHLAGMDADGLVLGGDMGPLDGDGRYSALRGEEMFLETVQNLPGMLHPVRPEGSVSPLDHVLETYESAHLTGSVIAGKLEASSARGWAFPDSEIGQQLRTAARLLDAGVEVPVLKVVQGGYDTHDGQPDEHPALLADLSDAVGAFANAAREMGIWEEVTVVTYSEFGRTARENGSAGTDHGTAAPVMVMGGAVQGGFDGARPSLTELVDGDLAHTTDYRRLYAAIMGDLWGMDAPMFDVGQGPAVRLLR